MSAEIVLRRATVDDAPALCLLNQDVQELHATHAPRLFKPWRDADAALHYFRELLARPRNRFELALIGDAPAGYVWWSIEERGETQFRYAIDRLYVHHIAVAPARRRAGVGRALLMHAIAMAKQVGTAGVVLDTWGFNQTAQAFFAALGFSVARIELYRPND